MSKRASAPELVYNFNGLIESIIERDRPEIEWELNRECERRLLAPGVTLEFGNLMTVVFGSIEQLRRQSLDEQGQEQLRRAELGARQAGRLIRQALSLARQEGSNGQLVNLSEAVRGFDTMLPHIAGENVEVTLELTPHPLLARIELAQLELALLSLVRITGAGQIVVRTSGHRVDGLGDQPTVELSVTATGAAPIVTTQEPSSDAGLAMAQRFASSCGGKMTIETAPGDGTTVRLVFPGASENQ